MRRRLIEHLFVHICQFTNIMFIITVIIIPLMSFFIYLVVNIISYSFSNSLLYLWYNNGCLDVSFTFVAFLSLIFSSFIIFPIISFALCIPQTYNKLLHDSQSQTIKPNKIYDFPTNSSNLKSKLSIHPQTIPQ